MLIAITQFLNGCDFAKAKPEYTSAGARVLSYGSNGMTLVDVGPGYAGPVETALQSSGKPVILYAYSENYIEYAVMRRNTDGTADNTFGVGGSRKLIPYAFNLNILSYFRSMAIQPDDKIILGGSLQVGDHATDVWLCRLNANGSLDTGFGTGGYVSYSFGANTRGSCNKVLVTSSGNIIAMTSCTTPGATEWDDDTYSEAVICFTESGTINTAYGNSGFLEDTDGHISVIDPSDRIIIANYNVLFRLNADGTVDTEYGDSGIVELENYAISDIALHGDGSVAIAAHYNNNGGVKIVSRVNSSGVLDTSFGTSGIVTITSPADIERFEACTVDSSDNIFLTGSFGADYTESTGFVVSLQSDGTLNTDFSSDGETSVAVGTVGTQFVDIIIADGTSPMVLGSTGYRDSIRGQSFDLLFAKFSAAGEPVSSFSGDGIELISVGNSMECTDKIIDFADGSCLAIGHSLLGYTNRIPILFKITPEGTQDTAFGNGTGKLLFVDGGIDYIDAAVFPDSKILLLGVKADEYGEYYDSPLFFSKLNTDGSFDTAFGTGGSVEYDADAGNCVEMLPDGSFLIAGTTTGGAFCAKFNADGTYDTDFNSGIAVASGVSLFAVSDICIQADGSILLSCNDGDDGIHVVRFTANGTHDTGFATNGVYTENSIEGHYYASSIEADAAGNITVSANLANISPRIVVLFRLNSDGTPDTAWGSGGKMMFTDSWLNDFGVQSDGKIIVPFFYGNLDTLVGEWCVSRYNADGTIDTGFGTNGTVKTDWGEGKNIPISMRILPNGTFFVGGFANGGTGYDMAVAKYYQ